MGNGRFELVIFDCDGVLVDSEVLTNRIFAEMLNEVGLPVTLNDMFETFVGKSMPQCLEIIATMLGGSVPLMFIDEYHARTTAALKRELKTVPGIETVLDTIELPYCVASSGTPEKMQITLGTTGLLPRFHGKIFSVTEVPRSKPFPDVFLHAAARMGAKPSACAVIEDTPTGVTAGVAAAMTVYGYCALTPAERLLDAGAHHVFSSMSDLPVLLVQQAGGLEPP